MSISYAWEKLHLATHSLCGSGSQTERLVNAVVFNLTHITPENDLPDSMVEEFEEFMKEITSVSAENDEGTIQATINKMGEVELSRAVEKVIGFYDKICRHMEK